MNRLTTLTLAFTLTFALSACGGEDPLDGIAEGEGEGEGGDGDIARGDGLSFTTLYEGHLQRCKACHADGALGFNPGVTEATLDLSSRDSAYTSITTGSASGLTGNVAACNGVPFIGASGAQSLFVAVMDEDVRRAFDDPDHPDCNGDTITDMNLQTGVAAPSDYLAILKAWIDAGAPNN